MKESLEKNDISDFGQILNDGWQLKRQPVNGISGQVIDELYEKAIKSGAIGGKLLGAGGGGFLLFYCEKNKLEKLEREPGLKSSDFRFEFDET